jgi:hypothetical protein
MPKLSEQDLRFSAWKLRYSITDYRSSLDSMDMKNDNFSAFHIFCNDYEPRSAFRLHHLILGKVESMRISSSQVSSSQIILWTVDNMTKFQISYEFFCCLKTEFDSLSQKTLPMAGFDWGLIQENTLQFQRDCPKQSQTSNKTFDYGNDFILDFPCPSIIWKLEFPTSAGWLAIEIVPYNNFTDQRRPNAYKT